MTPSKEAIDSCYSKIFHAAWESWRVDITNGLEAAYAIDVASLEARMKELEEAVKVKNAGLDLAKEDRDDTENYINDINKHITELEAENQALRTNLELSEMANAGMQKMIVKYEADLKVQGKFKRYRFNEIEECWDESAEGDTCICSYSEVKNLDAENQRLKEKLEHSQPEVDFDEWQK